jgi:hypothetical protein
VSLCSVGGGPGEGAPGSLLFLSFPRNSRFIPPPGLVAVPRDFPKYERLSLNSRAERKSFTHPASDGRGIDVVHSRGAGVFFIGDFFRHDVVHCKHKRLAKQTVGLVEEKRSIAGAKSTTTEIALNVNPAVIVARGLRGTSHNI